ncbi:hypothetical protein SpCBS45565_g05069 [Spizellomyces sp. 'palustris']|nr:hypothetical protein SpCBS45565_g05069 [Spizellomyces sp. 'palustris']
MSTIDTSNLRTSPDPLTASPRELSEMQKRAKRRDRRASNAEPGEELPVQWTPELEIVLFHALARFRPVGVHKHFRMLSVQRYFNKETGLDLTVNQLWAHLSNYYDLDALDAMADETDDDITFEARRKRSGYPFKVVAEFSLPTDDFESIIVEHRKAVSPVPDRGASTRRAGRASSPATESTRSTPEPQAEPETPATAPGKRGVGRPRKSAKKDIVQPISEPSLRRTRAASASSAAATPTPTSKRPRRNA